MTKLNPTQAAEQWGMGKSTLYRDMDNGKLSFSKDDAGKRLIDHSEMLRVYGEPKPSSSDSKNTHESFQIELMREMLDRQDKNNAELVKSLQAQIDIQQKQLEGLTESLNRVTHLLEYSEKKGEQETSQPSDVIHISAEPKPETAETPEPVHQPAKRKKSLLGRLLAAAIED